LREGKYCLTIRLNTLRQGRQGRRKGVKEKGKGIKHKGETDKRENCEKE
jgi:hypothetical protein